jgi:hypothetical protein
MIFDFFYYMVNITHIVFYRFLVFVLGMEV